MKKKILISTLLLVSIGLAGCGNESSNSNSSKQSSHKESIVKKHETDSFVPTKLTKQSQVKIFYSDYLNADTDAEATNNLENKVNNYLNSITNLKDYDVKTTFNAVDDNSNYAENLEIATVTLVRK